ncbi:hypothetical protein BC739_009367 [Kutzneria viridogrisea]|uniref:SH3 domain-containing protein n=1 Tax=Kutzneria viridogrisea TaxID=47990 RepID=A0ABR6BYW4_9PSEU|nr:hypothetical protein [Kutzneria viridogrisea]
MTLALAAMMLTGASAQAGTSAHLASPKTVSESCPGHLPVESHFNDDGINVRSGPGTGYTSLGLGYRGDLFCHTGNYADGDMLTCANGMQLNGWTEGTVNRTGVRGWVHMCYLS